VEQRIFPGWRGYGCLTRRDALSRRPRHGNQAGHKEKNNGKDNATGAPQPWKIAPRRLFRRLFFEGWWKEIVKHAANPSASRKQASFATQHAMAILSVSLRQQALPYNSAIGKANL
jgi:hypothetical protein